jgi:phage tail-like protein
MPSDIEHLGGDLPIANWFLFKLDGVPVGLFKEVKGLTVSIKAEDIVEGGQNSFVRKVPGRMMWDNITFTRGLTDSDAMFDWFAKTSGEGFAAASDKLVRRTGAIVAVTFTGEWLREWAVDGAFPVKWTGPEFGAGKNEPLQETLEIAHHGFKPSTNSRGAGGDVT